VIRKFLFFLVISYLPFVYASEWGISGTYPIITKDPSHLAGYRTAVTYQPKFLIWDHVQLYFDGGYGHWWITQPTPNRSLDIYAFAPYLRYFLIKKSTFSPYVEASIGFSYLNHTHLSNHNLGIHFAFQDQVGIGVAYGPEQKLYATLGALHYSNGSLASNNSGITVPLFITLGYRF
jgi:lipid A 3-O-deacylase